MNTIQSEFCEVGRDVGALIERITKWLNEDITSEQAAALLGLTQGEKVALPDWVATSQAAILPRVQALTQMVVQSVVMALCSKLGREDQLSAAFVAHVKPRSTN